MAHDVSRFNSLFTPPGSPEHGLLKGPFVTPTHSPAKKGTFVTPARVRHAEHIINGSSPSQDLMRSEKQAIFEAAQDLAGTIGRTIINNDNFFGHGG